MKRDKDIVLFSPYDIFKVYGKRMSEISISEMYYELLDNPKIRKIKRLNARRLYTEVKKLNLNQVILLKFLMIMSMKYIH